MKSWGSHFFCTWVRVFRARLFCPGLRATRGVAGSEKTPSRDVTSFGTSRRPLSLTKRLNRLALRSSEIQTTHGTAGYALWKHLQCRSYPARSVLPEGLSSVAWQHRECRWWHSTAAAAANQFSVLECDSWTPQRCWSSDDVASDCRLPPDITRTSINAPTISYRLMSSASVLTEKNI